MYVIAEIGCNHKGEIEIAEEMVKTAKTFCGVDAVKFQKRNPKKCLTEEQYNAPHPNPENSYGGTYGEHRERLEFTISQHDYLRRLCRVNHVDYGCSVWDIESLEEIIPIQPDFIKLPSAHNMNIPLLEAAITEYDGPLHISLGMTHLTEEHAIVKKVYTLAEDGRTVVLYACTSGYPVQFKDLCLKEIERLRCMYGQYGFNIGYSGHHLGIAADIAAMTLGAECIERHFTLNRTWKGTDHAASLEHDGMRRLVRDLKNVKQALTFKPDTMLEVEQEQRRKLKCLR